MSGLPPSLTKKYTIGIFQKAEEKARALFTPSDWFVLGVFIVIMASGAGILLANVSRSLSAEIPAQGGTLTEGLIGTPRFINPILAASETDRDLSSLVYAGLMKAEPDGSVSPHLASSFEVSDDGLQYTFHLKDNIYFHDGKPVTADDVVYTVQAAKNPELKSPKRVNWEGVEVVASDQKTVVFTLRSPYAPFLENTTLGILPKHLWASVAPEEFLFTELNVQPVGAGMYAIQSIKKNQSGVPTEYALAASRASDVRPHITRIHVVFFTDTAALTSALQNGDIDAAHSILPQEKGGLVTDEAVYARTFGVFFNQNQQKIFADEVVRRALDGAIDKNRIIATVLSGYGSPLSGPLPPSSVERIAYDEAGALERVSRVQAILEENGWKKGEDGIYQKTVKKETTRLAFTLATANAPELKRTAELLAEDWKAVGAEVTLQFFDLGDLSADVLRPRKYDTLLFGLVVGRELDLFAFWHSSQRNDPGLNIALYANIETDKYLEGARSELDREVREEKADRAAAIIAKETAALFLYAPHFVYVHDNRLRGVKMHSVSVPADRFAGVEDWYVATERIWPFFTN